MKQRSPRCAQFHVTYCDGYTVSLAYYWHVHHVMRCEEHVSYTDARSHFGFWRTKVYRFVDSKVFVDRTSLSDERENKTSIHNGRCALSSRDERTAGTTRRGRTNTTSSSMVAHCGRGCMPHCIGYDGGIVAHGGSCRRGAPRWRTPLTCTTRRSGRQGAQRDAGRVTDSAGNNEGD